MLPIGEVGDGAGEGNEPIRIPFKRLPDESPLLSIFAKRTIPTTTPKRNCNPLFFRNSNKAPLSTGAHVASQALLRRVVLDRYQVKHDDPPPREHCRGFLRAPEGSGRRTKRGTGEGKADKACEDPVYGRCRPVPHLVTSDRLRWSGLP